MLLVGSIAGAGFVFMVRGTKAAEAAGQPWTIGRMFAVAFVTAAVATAVSIAAPAMVLDLGKDSGPPSQFTSVVAPTGFTELPPGNGDVGDMGYLEAAQVIAPDDPADGESYLRETGFERGWSRHWVRGDVSTDSLVIRLFEFGAESGAQDFIGTEHDTTASTSIPSGVDDARITRVFSPDAASNGGPPTGPHRVLGIGRRCRLVATVFFRSAEDAHDDEEVAQLLRLALDGDANC